MSRVHGNNCRTTITSAINDTDTLIPVASVTGFPSIVAGVTMNLTLTDGTNFEIVTATSLSTLTYTVTRGAESTTARSWASGTKISCNVTAGSIDGRAAGPGSSTDNAVVRFDGTGGATLQNSGAILDDNGNLNTNNIHTGYTTTATAAGTTTLTVASTGTQRFTGSTTQTVKLPVTSTLELNFQFRIINDSSGVVTVQSSGGNTIQAMDGGTNAVFTCILTSGTTAASWSVAYSNASAGVPGGSNTQIQYNNSGAFGGDSGFTTDGAGSVNIVGDLDVDNININGNSLTSTDANGNINIIPNGTGAVNIGGNSTQPAELRFLEDSDNGSNYVGFKAPSSLAANKVWQLPSADGSSGQLLSTNGSGTLAFTSVSNTNGVFSYIGVATASSSATLSFTGIGNYAYVMFVFDNLLPATDDVEFRIRTSTNNGSSYDSAASDYSYGVIGRSGATTIAVGSAGAAQIVMSTGSAGLDVGNATGEGVSGELKLFNPTAAAYAKLIGQCGYINANGVGSISSFFGERNTAADVDAIQFFFESGNIASGSIYAYGVLKSNSGASGLNDGDYGDISISSSGTIISVDLPSSVTPASDDKIYLFDTSDSNNKKYCLVSDLGTGGGLTWNSASGTTQAAAVNNGYVCTNAAQCTVTLPGTAAVGDIVAVQGQGYSSGGIILAANTGQTIKGLGDTTTSAGNITLSNQYGGIEVVCIVANTTWSIRNHSAVTLTFA